METSYFSYVVKVVLVLSSRYKVLLKINKKWYSYYFDFDWQLYHSLLSRDISYFLNAMLLYPAFAKRKLGWWNRLLLSTVSKLTVVNFDSIHLLSPPINKIDELTMILVLHCPKTKVYKLPISQLLLSS